MDLSDPEPSRYVTLVSSDGFEFVVLRQAASISPAIKKMLDPKSEQQLAFPASGISDTRKTMG